jgi:outer membrane protein assembly factor BamB
MVGDVVVLRGAQESLFGVDLRSGKVLWRRPSDPASEQLACAAQGLVLARSGHLERLSPSDGKVLWAVDSPCRWDLIRVMGKLVVGTCVDEKAEQGGSWSLAGVDIEDGKTLWSARRFAGEMDGNDSMLVFEERYRSPEPGPHAPTPNRDVTLLEPRSGKLIWRHPIQGARVTPIVRGRSVAVIRAGKVVGLGAETGAETWNRDWRGDETPFFGFAGGLFGPTSTEKGFFLAGASGLSEWSIADGRDLRRIPWPALVLGPDGVESIHVEGDWVYLSGQPGTKAGLSVWNGRKWYRVDGFAPSDTPVAVRDGVVVVRRSMAVLGYSVVSLR